MWIVLCTLKVYRDEHDKRCRQCVKYKNAAFGKWARFKIIKKIFPDPISLYCLLKTPVEIKVIIAN